MRVIKLKKAETQHSMPVSACVFFVGLLKLELFLTTVTLNDISHSGLFRDYVCGIAVRTINCGSSTIFGFGYLADKITACCTYGCSD